MNDYIQRDKERKRKGYLLKIIVILLIFVIAILTYYIYLNIDISKPINQAGKNTAEKMSRTINEVEEENKTVSQLIAEINECVVGISKVKEVGDTIFLKDAVSSLGLGTGVIISENGYILTNEHVSGQKYSTCYITLNTGRNYKGSVVWSNTDIDMAIIKINEKKLPYAILGNSDNIQVGENVYAIGNPIGYEFQRTVTSGIISALNRTIKLEENDEEVYMEDLIQTDATINPGNSGGPLLNIRGEIIGINTIKITSAEGIGFAVPINVIKSVVESFINTGKFEEASLGIFAYDKNVIPYMNKNINITKDGIGIYVANVTKNSAADKAGIKNGDIIKSIDENKLERMCELRGYIYTKKPKDEVSLKILRNNREIEMKVKLERK